MFRISIRIVKRILENLPQMKSNLMRVLLPVLILVLGAGFIYWMNDLFNNSPLVRDVFCGNSGAPEVLGAVDPGSPDTLAKRGELTGRISMFIFAGITVLQFLALAVAFSVLAGIRRGSENSKLKLRELENADIFFDIPLYVGLFGTVSAFLVMTFSPQSSRLIAYSSTLIGIIFSLILRVTMLYPLRRRLLRGNETGEEK